MSFFLQPRLFSCLLAQEVAGAYSLIISAQICLLTAVYVYVAIPETKGRIFVEINRIFAKRNRVEVPEEEEEIADAEPHVPPLSATETSFCGCAHPQVLNSRLPSLRKGLPAPGLKRGEPLRNF